MSATAWTVNTNKPCGYCGNYHDGMCPRVEEIEYHNDGTVKRVKLRDPLMLPPYAAGRG